MKQFVVRLTSEKRKLREAIISALTRSSQETRRARIKIKVDIDDPCLAGGQVLK